MNITLFVPAQTALGENVWPWSGPGSQGQRHHFLGVALSINGGGIDPVKAELERAMNRRDRLFVVLFAPTKFPPRTAKGPRSKTNGSDEQIGMTKAVRFHFV